MLPLWLSDVIRFYNVPTSPQAQGIWAIFQPADRSDLLQCPTHYGRVLRCKVGGRYWGEHRKCAAFTPCIKNVKRVNFMLSKTSSYHRWIKRKDDLKCRIPVFPLRRRVAETRFDCCPRPRTPFLLVSKAALALAGRWGETEQNSVILNSCLPEKLAKHPHSSVHLELTAKLNFADAIQRRFQLRTNVYFVNSVAC